MFIRVRWRGLERERERERKGGREKEGGGEREKERERKERERERRGEEREVDEWIHGGVVGVTIDCFLVLWWTSGVAGSVCGRGFGSVYCGGLCMGHEVAGRAGGGRCGGGTIIPMVMMM